MADNIDTRIIQMQFDNRQFEKNIAKSQKSIEELKEAMDFEETSRGLQHFSRGIGALDFSRFGDNLQRLTDKFTGLGNAGEYVLSRIRYSLESTARSMEAFIKSISIGQISAGEAKYDALNRAVQTIIAGGKYDEEQAYSVMERVMTYTSQTSHNFQTMVGQIASLQSIGMGLSEAELLIEGIGNAATKAGGGAGEAATAMSVLSKAIGANYLSYQQFLTLSQTARVVTDEWRQKLIEAAIAVGDLTEKEGKYYTNSKYGKAEEVTARNLENTLAKRWASAETLKRLYSEYQFAATGGLDKEGKERTAEWLLAHPEEAIDSFGKTAYLTGQRALTFADSLNAIKESVSSGWMETFRITLGDVTEAAEFFTNMCDRVLESLEQIQEFRNNLFKSWRAIGGHDSLMDILLGDYWRETETGAVGFMDLLDGLGKTIRDGFVNFLTLFTDDLIMEKRMKNEPGYLADWLGYHMASITQKIEDFMKGIKDFFNAEIEVNGKTKTRLEVIQDVVNGIGAALFIGYQILKGVKEFVVSIATDLDPGMQAIFGLLGDLGAAIFNTAENTKGGSTIIRFFEDLRTTLQPVTDGINSIVIPLTKLLRLIFGLNDEDANFNGTFGTLGNIIITIADILSKFAGPILSFIGNILEALNSLLRGDINFELFGQQLGSSFSNMMKAFADSLPDGFKFLGDWIRDLFGLWEDDSDEHSKSFFGFLRKLFTEGFSSFNELLNGLTDGLSLTQFIKTKMGFGAAFDFLTTVAGWFKGTNLYGVIMAFLGVATLGTLFKLIFEAQKAVRTIGGMFDDFGGNIKAGVLGQYEWFSEKMVSVAKAFLMVALGVMALGALEPWALVRGVAAMLIIIIAISKVAKQMEQMKGTYLQQFAAVAIIDSIAAAIVAITLSISVLMLAMIPLASDWTKMLTAFLGFAAILGAIGVFIYLMVSKLDILTKVMGGGSGKKQWAGIGMLAVFMTLLSGFIVAVALSMSTLMLAMAPLAAIGWQGTLPVIISFITILASIGAFMVIILKQLNKMVGDGTKGEQWNKVGQIAVMMVVMGGVIALIAAGMSTLMLAMAPLAAVGWQGIGAAALAVGVILTELGLFITVMMKSFNKMIGEGSMKEQWANIGKMAVMLILLSGTVALLAVGIGMMIAAIMPFAVMGWENMLRSILGLGGILAALYLFMKLTSKLPAGATAKMIGFAGFAASIGLLVLALTPLALMDWEGWGRALGGLGIVLLELYFFMKLTSKLPAGATGKMIGFAGFAASLWLLIQGIIPLASLSIEGWGQALGGLAIVLLELIGFMWITNKLPAGASAKMIGFIGFAASIWLLMQALIPLAQMDTDGYYRAIFGLAAVLLEIVGLMHIMDKMKPNVKTAGSVLLLLFGVGAAMILFGIAFNEVKDVPWESMLAFGIAIAAIVAALGIAAKGAQALTLKGILMIALGLAAILAVVALIAPLVINSLAGALTNLAANFTLISNLLESASKNSANVDEGGIDKMIRILEKIKTLFLGIVGFIFTKDSINAFVEGIAGLNLAAGQLQMLGIKLSFVEEDGGIGKLRSFAQGLHKLFTEDLADIGSYESLANSFNTVMYQISTGLGTFRDLTSDVPNPDESNALKTIQALASTGSGLDILSKTNLNDFIGQMAGLGGAMMLYAQGAQEVGSLDEFGGDTEDIPDVSAAVKLMQAVSTSLQEAGGFAIPDNMPDETSLGLFGASLAALAGALIEFEQAGQGLGDGTEKALETLNFFEGLKTRLEQTHFGDNWNAIQENAGDAMTTNQTSALSTFGANISQLAQSMGQFANATSYIDEATGEVKTFDYSKATEAMTAIAELPGKIPPLGGAIEELIGRRVSLTTFAEQIELLGSSLNDFHTNTTATINGVPTEFDYTNAVTAMQRIAGIPKQLATEGLLTGLFIHVPTLTEFSAQIVALGGAMNQFAKDIQGDAEHPAFKPELVEPAIDSLDPIIELMRKLRQKLKTVGGVVQVFNNAIHGRDFELTDFSTQVTALGGSLSALASGLNGDETHKGFDPETVAPMVASMDSIIDLMNNLKEKLPTIGGLTNIFNTLMDGRSLTLTDFGPQIGALGDGLGKLGAGLNTGNFSDNTAITNAFNALDSILDVMIKLEKLDKMQGSAYAELDKLAYFVDGLAEMTQFGDNVPLDETVVGNIVKFMDNLNRAMIMMDSVEDPDDSKSLENMQKRIDIFASFAKGLNSLTNTNINVSWDAIGRKLTGSIADSIIGGISSIELAINTMLTSMNTKALNPEGITWSNIGKAVADGTASGITNNVSVVTIAAENMAKQAYAAAMATLDANSPSKVFMDVGSYIGLGMALGMTNTEGQVVDAATGMSESAIETAGTMMATISRIMAESTDANPTITPVLDLSNVEAGLTGLGNGRTFGIDASYSASRAGHLGRNESNRGSENQNGTNLDGIYERMSMLGQQITEMGKAITNMKIVLNSGVVAGGVTDDVDNNLGRKIFYAGRNN